MGIKRNRTTAYHPQANGKIERWHRAIKNSLRAHSDEASKTWYEDLPKILLGLRNCSKSNDSPSAAQLTFGQSARFPGDFIITEPKLCETEELSNIQKLIKNALEKQEKPREVKHDSFVSKLFLDCKKVWLRTEFRKSLDNPYEGPYDVVEKSEDNKSFVINIRGQNKRVSIDRLKPHMPTNEDTPESQEGAMLAN